MYGNFDSEITAFHRNALWVEKILNPKHSRPVGTFYAGPNTKGNNQNICPILFI